MSHTTANQIDMPLSGGLSGALVLREATTASVVASSSSVLIEMPTASVGGDILRRSCVIPFSVKGEVRGYRSCVFRGLKLVGKPLNL